MNSVAMMKTTFVEGCLISCLYFAVPECISGVISEQLKCVFWWWIK